MLRWKTHCFVTPQQWVFPNPNTLRPYRQETVAAQRIKAGLGRHIGWHSFRHTYRTWLDAAGAPVSIQRELMRHASIQTT